ncbi:TDP-N-acetylfucosamine:lipid II N-acetylfucosaminyltransferase [Pseudoalteromonas sp. OANN1]|uniref:TDP-N-acetylfucosamine:lipid II N-acetylfucosaminyltransferase n=1 Tax=Pseudoalteromonas sp. OANN1 TaxID=2954497 RepID=UPI0020969606|nr:TDP-N-acetylfucosamine:lipid II N-acetylfucosaminyltransferase [Pseudoalteromonas sp. OANN1]MCO7198226.1 TDP-N-acetylfucosamine:lipid II N-acetylfucosaminyltransferase [Pseudoalteromonas sp. OANN1]
MLIHIFSDTPHHYKPMVEFYLRYIESEQCFWVLGSDTNKDKDILFFSCEKELYQALDAQPSETRLVFHGLFSPVLIRNLALSHMLSRATCVLWGAEIYRNKNVQGLKGFLNWFAHRLLLSRAQCVITLNSGDAELVKNYMKLKRKVDILPYPLIDFGLTLANGQNEKLKILLGNSADPANNHKQLIDHVANADLPEFEVYMPLNYAGTKEYIQEIITYAQKRLGQCFIPITAIMSKPEYDSLLCKVDLSLFAHQRQQGLYVVYAMLLQGKPIFLDTCTSSYSDLTKQGFSLGDINKFSKLTNAELTQLIMQPMEINQQLMVSTFTEAALGPKWAAMLVDSND